MAEKKDTEPLEAARNAAIGYTTVVLAIACFILALMLITVCVRFIVGLSQANSAQTSAQTTTAITSTR